MPDKVSPSRFAAAVKEKYPEYKDYDDIKLTNAVIEKYPEYKDYVDFGVKEAQKPVVSQGFMTSAELPTFQKQVQEAVSRQPEQAQPQPSKYQKAVQDDRSEIAKTLSSLYNGVIGSFETLGKFVAGAPAQFAMQPYQVAPIDIGGTAKSAREFAELPIEQRLKPARQAQKGVEKVSDIVRSGYTTREEEKQMAGRFNVFDGEGVLGIGLKDIQGLIAMSGGMAADMALGALTGGTTFVAQGMQYAFDDYDEAVKKSGIKPDANARALYGMAGGIINGLLEKFAVDKLVGDTPVFRDIQRKALANVMKNTASMTGKAAVDAIEEAGVREIKRLTSDLRSKGVRALYRAGVEGGTEAVQAALEDGAKFAANAVQGNQAFNEDEIRKGFLQNIVNSAIAGGVMGPVLGAGADVTFGRNVNTELLKDIAQAKTPEDLQAIQIELTKTFDENNFSQEERDLIMSNMNRYAQIKQTLPEGTDPIAQTIVIPLIENRIKIDNEIQARRANLSNLDEALKSDEESAISVLEDRRAQINDDIREVVNNEKFNYFEKDGKYFKQLGENTPEEITKNRFDLQQIKTGEYATTEIQKPVEEGAPEGGVSEYPGAQKGRAQKTPIKADIGDSDISSEGSEISVKNLIGRQATYQGVTGTVFQEGQILSIESNDGKTIRELGNVEELSKVTPEEFGIKSQETIVEPTEEGFSINDEELFNANENPQDAISRDQNGKVMNVVLTTKSGKRRKFRGSVAEDLAYQITLKQISNEPEFETFLAESAAEELGPTEVPEVAVAAEEGAGRAVPTEQKAEARPAAPRQVITTQPTIGRVTAENVERVTDLGTTRIQKKVLNDVKRVFNAIKSIVPATTGAEVTINLHDQESFKNAVLEAGGTEQDSTSRGFYMAPDGSIHINMDNLASDTMLHEGFHPILDFIEQANPAQIDEFFTQLEAIPEAAGIIAQARQNYEGDTTQKKEAITDFVAGVADGRVVLNPTNFQKIKAFIQNMLNKIGIGQGQVLMNVKNQSDLIKLANFVSEKFVKGEEIQYDNLGDFTEKTPTPFEPIAKSGQLQFQKTIYDESGIVKSPALDRSEFKIAVDEGRISVVNPYESLKDKFFAITFPDDFFTGEIKFDGETIAYGNGGVFFAARFGKRGDVWAAAGENSANNFVIQANNSLKKNNGEGIIVLSKGDDIKQSTSLEANIAFINTIIKYAEKNGQLDQVVKAIKTTYSIGRAKSADTIIDSFNQFLAGGRGESGQRMVDAKNAFNTMSSALIKEAGPLMTKMLRDMGFDGDTFFNKTKLAKGEYVATTQGLKSMYIDMLQEDFLKGLNNGAVYAALKFNSEIKYEKDPYHPSYPYVMRTVDGSPVKLEVFTKTFNSYGKEGVAIYGQERNKENAFGVATTTKPDFKLDPSFEDNPSQRDLSQKLDEYSALKKPQFQKAKRLAPNGSPSNLNERQYNQVRTPEFKKWFGDWENDPANASKVVDENGEPLVVYHGSASDDIEIFDRQKAKRVSSGLLEFGTYFTDNKELAKIYASAPLSEDIKNEIKKKISILNNKLDNVRSNREFNNITSEIDALENKLKGRGGKIYEVFLNLRKVKEFDGNGESGVSAWRNLKVDAGYKIANNRDAMLFLKEGKFGVEKVDGIVANNISDVSELATDETKKKTIGTVYLVFDGDANKIKSATENTGDFSIQDNRIQFQKITEKPTRTEVFLKEQFRYGILGKEIIKFKDQMTGELNAEVKEAERLTKKAQDVIKKYGTALSRADILNFMTGKPTSTPLPTDVSNVLTDMRAHIDTLTERLIQLGVIEDQETIDYYRQNKGEYLVRSYEAINYKDGIMQRLGKGGLNVDNVAKKLKNVDKTVVNTALKFLANRARLIDQIKWSLNDDGTYNVEYYKTGKLQYKTENVKETDLATEIGTGNANEIIDYKKDPQNKVKKGSLTTIEDDIVEGKPVKKMVDTVYNKEMSESDAMKVARKDANDILSDAEAYVSRNSLTGSTNVKSLSKRKEISPEIRALMGEYTDPLYNYYASVFKIANLTSSRQYLNNLRDYGLGKFLFTKEDRPDDATTLIAAEGSETLSPLNGLYTFKPVAESLQKAENEKTSIALQLIGRIRKFKTVYNPATHVKNVIGNMGFVVSNGHWNYLPESYKYVRALVTGKDDAEIRRVMDTLNRYNVLNNAVGVNELKSYFDRYENVDDFLGKIYDDGRKKSKLSKIAEAAGKVGEAMEKAYAIEDDAFKILAFVNESSRYSKALYNKSYANLNESQKKVIDDRVSEIVKDTYPTFSRVPKFVKNLSKYAFLGNFLSFPAESIRVQYNSLKLALNEYNSGNPKLKTIGLTRMAGFLIYNSLFSSLVYYSYNLAGAGLTGMLGYFGDDDSEEKKKESAIHKFLAPWNMAKDIYVSSFENGKLVYYDIGSLDSYGYQKQVWNSFWGNINDDKGFYKSVSEAVGKGIEPWIELDFTIKNLSALFTNDDGRGGRIYNPEDSFVERVKKTAEFTGKQFGPGALGAMIKIADSYQKGESDKVKDELISQVFARKYTVDLKKQFQNYIYVEGTPKMEVGFKNRLSDAEKIYRDAKKQGLKGAELEARYQDAVRAYKEILKTANEYYKAAAAGGVPANALTNIVVNARMGRAASMAIINGYMPDIDMMYIRR